MVFYVVSCSPTPRQRCMKPDACNQKKNWKSTKKYRRRQGTPIGAEAGETEQNHRRFRPEPKPQTSRLIVTNMDNLPIHLDRHTRRRSSLLVPNSAIELPVLATRCSVSGLQESDDNSGVNYEARETQWLNGCYVDPITHSSPIASMKVPQSPQQHSQQEGEVQNSNLSLLQPSQDPAHYISGLVVFDRSMFGPHGGNSFIENYGHLLNGFNSGVSSFSDEPFC
ncbi:hypothetical protein R1flu_018663 [Riccia fluitans]|uniref:Dof-type domain-containing protein n=1 Tax=Riccia fluitans TaxID=41844 RepID=A0ABD1ZGH8_9MARC